MHPTAITRSHGSVKNAQALTKENGTTTMTVEPGGPPAVVVLDYGQEVGGTPYLEVRAASGSPQVRISTSEALPFLNSNQTTTLSAAAAKRQKNVKVTSTAPFYPGTSITIGSGGTAETAKVTDVGTSAARETATVLSADAGDGNVKVADVSGYAVGGPLTIGSGAAAIKATISKVGTSAGAPTTLVYPAEAGSTNVKVADTTGFGVGDQAVTGSGDDAVVRTVGEVGTAASTGQLLAAAVAGDDNLKVSRVDGLTVGAEIDVDPGPAQEHVTVTDVGTAGVSTSVAAANTTSGIAVPSLAGANWIWNAAGAASNTTAGTIYVRKTFDVSDPAALSSAVLRINADDSHTTYVNGTEVATSAGIDNAWRTSQIVDIKPLLVPGMNVIATAVTNAGSGGGLLVSADIGSEHLVSDGTWKALAGTPASPPSGWAEAGFDDTSWTAAIVTGAYGISPWNSSIAEPPGPTTLRVASNAGFEPGDQISIGSGDESETRAVTSVTGTGGSQVLTVDSPLSVVHAVGSPVLNTSKPGTGVGIAPVLAAAHGVGTTVASPGTGITFTTALDATIDAGTAIQSLGSGITFTPALASPVPAGTPVNSAGTGVSFKPALKNAHDPGETVTGLGTYVNDNGGQINLTIDEPRTYTGALRGGFRFEAIELRTPGTIKIRTAGLNFKAYRATPEQYQGWFLSSDDQLNRMWYAGAYTAQMDMVPPGVEQCFDKPVIFDGAKRDRAIWSGDLMISDPVAMLSLGSNASPYVTGSIDAFMDLQAPNGRLTSAVGFRGCGGFDYAMTYSAYSAMIAVQYYRYTGDTAYIESVLPNLEAALTYHATRLDENGLVVTNDNDYWQTRQNGEVTEYNLVYLEFLQDMAWLQTHVGNPDKAVDYNARAAALKEAINAHLFNAQEGLYQHTDSRPDVFPLDANMNAVRLGVAPADQVQHILDYFQNAWLEHGSEISQPGPSMADPYGHTIEPLNNTWEMLARLRSNDAAGALELMRRMWGLQVNPDSGYYTGTFWEFVLENGLPSRGFDSLAHAWGAGPTQVLTEAVVGATAIDPGYAKWEVKPQPTDLEWAQGQVPTAHGALQVRWAQDEKARAGSSDGTFHLQVTAPEGTSGEVWVPLSSANGSVSKALTPGSQWIRRDGSYDVYNVGSGTFEFSSFPVDYEPRGPEVTVKDGAQYTVGSDGLYSKVSFKLHDPSKVDRLTLNGVEKDLTDNTWSDLNFVAPGKFGAVEGKNTLKVYDVLGNSTTVEFSLDATGPQVTVKDGAQYTVGSDGVYSKVSFKLHDPSKVDRLTLNGVEKDLTDNTWSDLNYVAPGEFGATTGENTLVVNDLLGNTTTVVFTLS